VRGPAVLTVGHQEGLTALTQTTVNRSFKGRFEVLTLGLTQGECNHGASSFRDSWEDT
jgi:hypothetical protein